jgi:putative tryptophan/tyrosine transport system substrate-binding protein
VNRRAFIAALGGAVAWQPFVVLAQQGRKVFRLGILTVGPDRNLDGLFQGLRDLGYVDGQNLIIERRYSGGQAERWSDLANELVGLKVDIIVVNTTPAALAAKKATSTIPIVFPTAFDPVGAGLADSLAKPGGNVTGLGLFIPEVNAKGLALLREAVPPLTEVAVLWNAANPANSIVWRDVEATARAIGLALHPQEVREPKDFDAAFAAITQQRPGGLLVLVDALLNQYKSQIVDFTIHKQLPAVFPFREFTELGGLMSYGPNLPDMFRKGAGYVDKILKGAKPADLPIEQPTKFELVINLKTAKALGLDIPTSLLARADEVIE